ncbi:hypothetical protein GY45DRAFT_1327713 [Cubamyces sp. BRFM 1775]|nr:hypothetical protein GY45DRAFT_1327713 [Cubamyces sp. BRFM 1775]
MGLGRSDGRLLTISVCRIAVDFLRTGAFTSMVVVELSWLCTSSFRSHLARRHNTHVGCIAVLWVLWLATGAQTASQTSTAFANCDFIYPILNQVCNETHAIEAFSFLAWIVRECPLCLWAPGRARGSMGISGLRSCSLFSSSLFRTARFPFGRDRAKFGARACGLSHLKLLAHVLWHTLPILHVRDIRGYDS